MLFLRRTYGRSARIVLCRMDVKEAFRQVLVDPVGASVFGYVTGGRVVVDLRLQLGWRNSPGYWGLLASALDFSPFAFMCNRTPRTLNAGEYRQYSSQY